MFYLMGMEYVGVQIPKRLKDKVVPLLSESEARSFRAFVVKAVEDAAWQAWLDHAEQFGSPLLDVGSDAKRAWLTE